MSSHPALGMLNKPGLSWLLPIVLLLLASGASSQEPAPPPASSPASLRAPSEQEPITPIPAAPDADPRKVALGASLFSDRALSEDGQRACASCHDVHFGGADNGRHRTVPNGSAVSFTTLPVFNAALNHRLNWEGNIRSLEAQAEAALTDRQTMSSSVGAAIQALSREPGMRERFVEAYGHGPDRDSLLDAIATYERSLLTPGSPFDRWLLGETDALTPEQLNGYRLFKSLGCVSCHQGVNVGGNLFERSGVFHELTADGAPVLRVPSLRNVAVNPPYFHDGSTVTLDKAVRRMGYVQLDRNLSDEQVAAIVDFLGSLTGTYQGRKLIAPP